MTADDSLDAARERAGFAGALGDGTEEYVAKAGHSVEKDALRHKPFGTTHPTWEQPTNFYYDTEAEAWAAIERVYGPDSGHLVVGVLTRVTPPAEADPNGGAR